MTTLRSLVLSLVLLAALPARGHGDALDPWARWRFLLGEWQGTGAGDPGSGTGGSTFALELDGHILVRRNHAEYPATASRPASSHQDLLIVYPGASDSLFRAVYFDNEGHMIEYRALVPATGGRAVLDSEGPGSGPRFRLLYAARADGGLDVEFDIAPPGGELSRYVSGALQRVPPPAKR